MKRILVSFLIVISLVTPADGLDLSDLDDALTAAVVVGAAVLSGKLAYDSACYLSTSFFAKEPLVTRTHDDFDDDFYRECARAHGPSVTVGYLEVTGPIQDTRQHIHQLHTFVDEDIDALLVYIDSPGGLPGPSQALYNELKRVDESIPVIALVDNLCASGGYLIACGASHIIANEQSSIGSIGVRLETSHLQGPIEYRDKKIKGTLVYNEVAAGQYKTVGSFLREPSAEERRYLESRIAERYDSFIQLVAASRGLSVDDKDMWAEGQVFQGTKAYELGLIDALGTLSDAKDYILGLLRRRGSAGATEVDIIFADKEDNPFDFDPSLNPYAPDFVMTQPHEVMV